MSYPEVNNSECYIWSGSWCHHYPREDIGLKFWLLTGSQRVTFSPPVSSQEKKPEWPLHRSPCMVLASFWFSLSLDTLESFWKMHLIYSKGHGNKGFYSIAMSMLGQVLKFQSLWGFFFFFFFFLTSTVQQWMKITGIQGCRWNRTNCCSVCMRLSRNRVPIFSELKISSVLWQIWMTSWEKWDRIFEIKNVGDSPGCVVSVHTRGSISFKFDES